MHYRNQLIYKEIPISSQTAPEWKRAFMMQKVELFTTQDGQAQQRGNAL